MPLYEYKAYDKSGKSLSGLIDAASRAVAYEKLKSKGIFPSSITQEKGNRFYFSFNLKEQLATTLLQLASLLRAGLPVIRALDVLSGQIKNDVLKIAYIKTKVFIQEGDSFAAALSKNKIFPKLLIYMLEAGETIGMLDIVLEEYSKKLSREVELQKKILVSMTYPVIIIISCLLLVIFILTYIAPTIIGIFEGFKTNLPWSTRLLLAIGGFLKKYIILIILLFGGAIFAFIKFVPVYVKEKIITHIPFVSTLTVYSAYERWTSTLAMLYRGGVTLVKALNSSAEVVDFKALQAKFKALSPRVEKGESVSAAMRAVGGFPSLILQMVETGEQTAQLDKMLDTAAGFYEKEIARKLTLLVSVLEPIMILILGGIVTFVVVSILLPIFDINKLIR